MKIGSGKFGKVYSATLKDTGQKVAIKTVFKNLLEKFNFYEQMKKELEIQYRLSCHPNIAHVYGYFYDD